MGFAEDMAELEAAWDEAPAESPGGEYGPELKDGEHQVLLVAADVRQRQSDDHWQLYFKFQNRSGSIRKWSDLDHEVGLKVAKADAVRLGFPEDGKLPALEAACAGFVGQVCDIRVKTTPGNERDFKNVYLNAVHGPAADPSTFDLDPSLVGTGDAAPAASTSAADDDIPF